MIKTLIQMRMQKFTLLIIAMVIAIGMSAQTFEPTTGTTKEADKAVIITIDGDDYEVFVTADDNHYYFRTSKSGNTRREYLGVPTTITHEDKPVYTNTKGTAYYHLYINKNGYPARRQLKEKA